MYFFQIFFHYKLLKNIEYSFPCYTVGLCWLSIYMLRWLSIYMTWSVMSNFVTPQTVTCQAPLSMGLSRQEYWSELLCPPQGSSWPRNWTTSTCIGRQILYHWATWEASPLKTNYCIFGGLPPSESRPHSVCRVFLPGSLLPFETDCILSPEHVSL